MTQILSNGLKALAGEKPEKKVLEFTHQIGRNSFLLPMNLVIDTIEGRYNHFLSQKKEGSRSNPVHARFIDIISINDGSLTVLLAMLIRQVLIRAQSSVNIQSMLFTFETQVQGFPKDIIFSSLFKILFEVLLY